MTRLAAIMAAATAPRVRYLNSLRSPAKRHYGHAYAAWLDNGRTGPEPAPALPLSAMAAQAVRFRLHDFEESIGASVNEWAYDSFADDGCEVAS